jgi:hypothetical protein
MRCPEFLTLYSDYRDGVIVDLGVMRRVRQHLDECTQCRRYDAIIRRGVATLRGAELKGVPRASWGTPDEEILEPAPARSMGALVLLAALTLLVWEGRGTPDDGDAAPGIPRTPRPVAIANPGVPFVRFVDHTTPEPAADPAPAPDQPAISPALTLYQPTPDR